MTFDEYQKRAMTTDVFGGKPQPITTQAFFAKLLGLVGETGEIAEKFKKIYRDGKGELDASGKADIQKELGDVLWYIATVAAYLEIDLDDIATGNLAKLQDRHTRGALKGSGDNR